MIALGSAIRCQLRKAIKKCVVARLDPVTEVWPNCGVRDHWTSSRCRQMSVAAKEQWNDTYCRPPLTEDKDSR